jgi:hypothetical protein
MGDLRFSENVSRSIWSRDYFHDINIIRYNQYKKSDSLASCDFWGRAPRSPKPFAR